MHAMPYWLHRIVARLLLVTMMISAAGLTFGREILQDGPTVADSISAIASASHHDGQPTQQSIDMKACDHSCHNVFHFLGQLPADTVTHLPLLTAQGVPRIKQLAARDHSENPFRPPDSPPRSLRGRRFLTWQ